MSPSLVEPVSPEPPALSPQSCVECDDEDASAEAGSAAPLSMVVAQQQPWRKRPLSAMQMTKVQASPPRPLVEMGEEELEAEVQLLMHIGEAEDSTDDQTDGFLWADGSAEDSQNQGGEVHLDAIVCKAESVDFLHKAKGKGKKKSEAANAASHLEAAKGGFRDFLCKCRIAKARGTDSCLVEFTGRQFLAFHKATYSDAEQEKISSQVRKVQKSGESLSSLQTEHMSKTIALSVSLETVSTNLHKHIWEQKVPIPKEKIKEGVDADGRCFSLNIWTLDDIQVCRDAWVLARGGTARRHRDLRALVCRGISPTSSTNSKEASKVAKLLTGMWDKGGKKDSERRGFAAEWWRKSFMLMDFLPNEDRIQIRGPSFDIYHKQIYGPVAKRCSDRYGVVYINPRFILCIANSCQTTLSCQSWALLVVQGVEGLCQGRAALGGW